MTSLATAHLEVVRTRPRYPEGTRVRKDVFAQTCGDVVRHAFRDTAPPGEPPFDVSISLAVGQGVLILHVAKIVIDALVEEGVLPSDRVSHLPVLSVRRQGAGAEPGHTVAVRSLASGTVLSRHVDFEARPWRPPSVAPEESGLFADVCEEYGRAVRLAAATLAGSGVPQLLSSADGHGRVHVDLGTPTRNIDLDNAGLFVLDALTSFGSAFSPPGDIDGIIDAIQLTWRESCTPGITITVCESARRA